MIELDLDSAKAKERIANGPFYLDVDQHLRIVVDENPTTGYIWIVNDKANGGIYSITKNEYIKEPVVNGGDLRLAGHGGTRVFDLVMTNYGNANF